MSNTQNKNVEEKLESLWAEAAARVAHVKQVAENELTRLIVEEGRERAVNMSISQDEGRPPSWVTIQIPGQFITMPPTATDEEIECAVGNLFDLFVKLSRD